MGVSRDLDPSHGVLQQSGLLPVQSHQAGDQGKGNHQRRIDQVDGKCQQRKSKVEPRKSEVEPRKPAVEPRKPAVDEYAVDR